MLVTTLQFEVTPCQGRVPVTVLQVKGDIDASNYGQFQSAAYQAIEAGARDLLLDMSQVNYVSSAGLRVLHNLSNTLRSQNDQVEKSSIQHGSFKSAHLKLFNPSPNVRKLLNVTGFDMFLEIHSDFDQAVASF